MHLIDSKTCINVHSKCRPRKILWTIKYCANLCDLMTPSYQKGDGKSMLLCTLALLKVSRINSVAADDKVNVQRFLN